MYTEQEQRDQHPDLFVFYYSFYRLSLPVLQPEVTLQFSTPLSTEYSRNLHNNHVFLHLLLIVQKFSSITELLSMSIDLINQAPVVKLPNKREYERCSRPSRVPSYGYATHPAEEGLAC